MPPRHAVLAALLGAVVTAGLLTGLASPAAAAVTAGPSVAPSAGPRTPADPSAQLTTGMMPPDSPDAQAARATAQNAPAPSPRAATAYLNGIDVASYQHATPITWSQVAASGQSFVVVKATESTTYTNPYEPGDVAGARQAGLRVGLYHFARPSLVNGSPAADAQAEADYFSRQVNAVGGAQLPPTLDLETSGGLSQSQLTAWTAAFLSRVQADTGRRPMIYTGPYFWNTYVGSTAFTSYPLWVAHYTTAANPQSFGGWSDWTIWQWTDGTYFSPGGVPGISGAVDRDRYRGTLGGLESVEAASNGVAWPFVGTATSAQFPDGTLISVAGSPEVYVIAGRAPLYLSTWAGYPGSHQVRVIPVLAFLSLRSSPVDGTFLNSVQSGQVYQVVGQAPLYVTSWAPYHRAMPYVNISQATLDNAGAGGVWSHLRFRPLDGTFLNAFETGAVYRVVGGAPTYVSSWSYFGGVQPYSQVSDAIIELAASSPAVPGPLSHLLFRPADGTAISDPVAGTWYTTAGGRLVPVTNTGQAFTSIGHTAVVNAGQPGVWAHLAG
ncbi:MAG TPA: GH25 family lysozyme [Mycobacteriales bacterium]